VGSKFRNPDLADTYRLLAKRGMGAIYHGKLGREIVDAVQNPPKVEGTTLPVPEGFMETSDLASYQAKIRKPTQSTYRGLEIYGMAPPSSGGTTVGEALNILERVTARSDTPVDRMHKYLESSALAYADRAANLGDPDFVDVPVRELLAKGFAAERACNIDPAQAATKPVPAGSPDGDYDPACPAATTGTVADDHEGLSTTHLTAVDRWGNVASYTLTIEQTGGSGITVPGRGFILNNELTDFSTTYVATDPNRIQPGKRPRSSMSPTIVMRHDRPWLALGSPGGSTIITTVLQTLVNRIDLRMSLLDAVAAPRAQQSNSANTNAEQAFIDLYGADLMARGHAFGPPPAEIGAATAIELLPGGKLLAVSEPVRRGGGDAQVVRRR
jgi:gamma-glutamyltranspeptidase/glutathione hydrolase